ncbi:hypothetical protein BDA96_04G335100 [Sorghum bicolor]|uniref:Uncharacterized protein n=1 Tax=Sorghum bicolor TaxID=4558 RepID=A0A921UKR0_SORBI|nr:hypothetical protein BDA96_04G335100 [Sorghum bicolor]
MAPPMGGAPEAAPAPAPGSPFSLLPRRVPRSSEAAAATAAHWTVSGEASSRTSLSLSIYRCGACGGDMAALCVGHRRERPRLVGGPRHGVVAAGRRRWLHLPLLQRRLVQVLRVDPLFLVLSARRVSNGFWRHISASVLHDMVEAIQDSRFEAQFFFISLLPLSLKLSSRIIDVRPCKNVKFPICFDHGNQETCRVSFRNSKWQLINFLGSLKREGYLKIKKLAAQH